MDSVYVQKMLFKVAMILVIVGSLNWFTVGALNVNLVEKIFGKNTWPTRTVYILVGVAAITMMFRRDTYLPFLGESVIPCSALPEQIPDNADIQVEVQVTPGAKVLYWAAEPETEKLKQIHDWRQAYQNYKNVGVVQANADGIAVLLVRNPQPYRVPFKGRLESHVHFRVCKEDGFMGSIQTVFLKDGQLM
jgi:uncharacterized membrane protein YuzA (DUF378 family)